jgi:PAS domain S-box-containing protein
MLAPDLMVLLGEVGAGMLARTRTMILDEQEAVRAALFNAYQAAEAARRASEERLHTVIANAPIVLFAVDRAGVLTFCEGKGLEVLGLRPDACVGQGIFDVYGSSPAVADHVRRALDGEALRAIVEEGGRAFDTWYAPLRDRNGAIDGVLGVAVDITERKRAEEERLAFEQLKSEFVANISHDLRTPLHHIKGYALLLLQQRAGFDEQTQQEFLQTITTASDRLDRLISDLLEMAQMTSGTLTLRRERVRIDNLVRSVVQRWQGMRSHGFIMRSPTTVPALQADPGRIEQVLDNLLTNVTRHTPEGTTTEVDIEPMDAEAVISVIDHGPGVASEHLPRLFDRFYQVESRKDGQRRGTGLGLAICKWLVEQHGGRVWAEQTPGGGLTVRFSLPREP